MLLMWSLMTATQLTVITALFPRSTMRLSPLPVILKSPPSLKWVSCRTLLSSQPMGFAGAGGALGVGITSAVAASTAWISSSRHILTLQSSTWTVYQRTGRAMERPLLLLLLPSQRAPRRLRRQAPLRPRSPLLPRPRAPLPLLLPQPLQGCPRSGSNGKLNSLLGLFQTAANLIEYSGGTNWTGPTVCVSGTTCTAQSPPWYYQCL